jgi:WD40 repeat protein
MLAVGHNLNDYSSSRITLYAFDGKSLAAGRAFNLHGPIGPLAWGPGDRNIVVGGEDGTLLSQSLTGKGTASISAHDGYINTLTWSSDFKELFTAGMDGTIKVWQYDDTNRNQLTLSMTLRHETGAVYAIAVMPNGNGIYTGGSSPHVYYWEAARYLAENVIARAQKMVSRNMFGAEWDRFAEGYLEKSKPYRKTFKELPYLSHIKRP